jgi:NRPS condensation-like uncharacterized protein
VVIHLFAVFDERLDVPTLKVAHGLLFRQIPGIACDLVGEEWQRRSFDVGAQLGCVDLSSVPFAHARDFAEPFVAHDPRPGKAPQLKSLLIRFEKKDLLILQAHHTALDGAGLRHVLYQLASNYTQLANGEPPLCPSAHSTSTALKAIASAMTGEQMRRARQITERDRFRFLVGGRPYRLRSQQTGRPSYVTLRIPAGLAARIRSKPPVGATMNDLLLATMATALTRADGVQGGPTVRISIAIDLRRYLASERVVYANLGSVAPVQIRLTAGEDADTALHRVVRETAYLKAHGIGLPQLQALPKLRAANVRELGALRFGYRMLDAAEIDGPVLTNLGRFERERCRFGSLFPRTVSFAPSIPRGGRGLIAGVSSYGDDITIHMGHSDAPSGASVRRDFADVWASTLTGYAGMGSSRGAVLIDSLADL